MKMSKSAFRGLVKRCIAEVIIETSQTEPYDPETDQFAPGPRDRTEPSARDIPSDMIRQMTRRDIRKAETARQIKPKSDAELDGMTLGQLQRYYNEIGTFDQSVHVPGIGWGGNPLKESEPPHEKWEDTFGNKMAGEYIAEDMGMMGTMTEAGAQKVDRISPGERNKIGKAFQQLGLDGNGRFESVEAGLAAVTRALSSFGFNLDMVSKDMIMGDQGSRNFIYRRANAPEQDPFTEQPELKNSRLVFSWQLMSPEKFEILAYAS